MTNPTADQETYHRGIPTVPYDLLKELVLAFVASGIVILVLAIGLSSPEVPPLTIQTWAQEDPVDFVTTATSLYGYVTRKRCEVGVDALLGSTTVTVWRCQVDGSKLFWASRSLSDTSGSRSAPIAVFT